MYVLNGEKFKSTQAENQNSLVMSIKILREIYLVLFGCNFQQSCMAKCFEGTLRTNLMEKSLVF